MRALFSAFGAVHVLLLLLLSGSTKMTVRMASSFNNFANSGPVVHHRSVPSSGAAVVTSSRRPAGAVAMASLPEPAHHHGAEGSSGDDESEGAGDGHSSPIQWSRSWSLGRREAVVSLSLALMLSTTIAASPPVAHADEYGRETEAPTLFTGENVMICTKRGPLGACLKTEVRTAENDNDKASKYMKSQDGDVKRKDAAMRAAAVDQEGGGSELLTRLRQQTEDNRERKERLVMQKTIENNQAASFGPFDRQTVILNADGKGYTLLENPQAMRLKKAGYIKDRQFVTQPTAEVMNEALGPSPEESSGFVGGVIRSVFGGGGD